MAYNYKENCINRYESRKKDSYFNHLHFGMSSFDEVVKVYESITPVRTKRTDMRFTDRRPLNSRWKWWERVIKFDDNTYGLGDGHEWWWNTEKELKQTVPILWERKADGEYLTIRNHYHKFQTSWTRFDFLGYYLPKGVTFWYNSSGKHYINYENTDYALPKMVSKVNWGQLGSIEVIQDNKIVLKREGDKFIRINNLLPVSTKRKGQIAYQYQDKILKFWEWANIMLPVLGDSLTFDGLNIYSESLTDDKSGMWYWHQHTKPTEILEILDDEEHPKRMALAVCIAYSISSFMVGRHYVPTSTSRQKFVDMIRKIGNMYDIDYK